MTDKEIKESFNKLIDTFTHMTDKEIRENFDKLLDSFAESQPEYYPNEKYSIPKEIKDKIPDYFYIAMAGELVSIFGIDVLDKYDCYELYAFEYHESTAGWVEAFKATCKKLSMNWLYDYWDKLEWYDSDWFDGEIGVGIANIMPMLGNHANSYYLYLIGQDKNSVL